MNIFCSVVLRLDMSLHLHRSHLEKGFLFLIKHALINSSIFKIEQNSQHCLMSVRGVELVVRADDVMWNMLAVSVACQLSCIAKGHGSFVTHFHTVLDVMTD
jgi:hypothetical protein